MPGLTIGDTIPNLEVNTTNGKFKIHDFVGDGLAIIFSHPGDFTLVCTMELVKMAQYQEEFEKRGVKLLGLSCDDLQIHTEWIKDVRRSIRRRKHWIITNRKLDSNNHIDLQL